MSITRNKQAAPSGLLTVARKELTDHLTSRTFLVFAVLLVVVCILPFQQGLTGYQATQAAYAAGPVVTPWGVEEFGSSLPNAADVYARLPGELSTVGAILAIAMGFDLVSRERQNGSLKLLLVRPIFRDEIVTGKALGGLLALTALIAAGLAVSLAVLLIEGIVPGPDDLVSISLFGIATVAFLAFYFSLALAISTVVPRTGKAFLYALIAFFIFSAVIPAAGEVAKDTFAGAHPLPGASPAEREEYQARLDLVESVVTVFSPQRNYKLVAKSTLEPRLTAYSFLGGSWVFLPDDGSAHPMDALARFWQNALVLFLAPLALFVLAYIAFQRMDVR
jgi:ABC-2 type transport system permease protein